MTELVVDALPSQTNNSETLQQLKIDLEVLKNVEKDLENHEKLTLLFLILEDYNCFQQVYEAFCVLNVENILSNFAGSIREWQMKLFEALCITKAKREIRFLGLSYDELERIFVPAAVHLEPPNSGRTQVHIGAKLLFYLFDKDLGEKERIKLLGKVYEQIRPPEELKNNDPMEIHALYWIQQRYIALTSDGRGNLENLLKPLKAMGLSEHTRYLDLQKYSSKAGLKIPSLPKPLEKVPSLPTIPQASNLIQSAYVVVLNVISIPNTLYEDRTSSNVDVARLEETFKGLRYTVKVYGDPTIHRIKEIFTDLKSNFDREKHDALIVCILSHGVEGHFVSHDNVDVPLSSIEKFMCTPRLRHLPKILMIQACQGNKIGHVIKNDVVTDSPREADNTINRISSINTVDHDLFLQFSATMREFKALRHVTEGSWFINAVCDVLAEPRGQESSLSILQWTQKVNQLVKKNKGQLRQGVFVSQLPEVLLRFDEDFFFPTYRKD
ncbi:caspase-8-like [Fopius arisanus]|uniref:Caspase-8-like n=1 Tax=Fopius arisanus TaxID=64838 RepID=A0A0C9QWR7_9HYME|nr:PREDICTED: caspase-8-like [Fopius arisanus]